ncbi:CPBP family intramembrane glutamic endopeptidase [Halogeometricum sp. CBA1124]|jgi:hypothetical protein|uniref:CPBP family intramembrane glutamic endopeptidase n=1 Tax=Halogeometricum sp. CBA1124 TaxID=2668071 RepID=UPI00142970F5|nr:type II CAAX endopeptidase family protein [Halogeometricum sp. CBA1124]MUV56558.1 CPBP family intramembrane metalloprotease [Halogeometricum sp. CBA1124]
MLRRVKAILWNEQVHRPRLLWRLLALIAVVALLGTFASVAVGFVSGGPIESLLVLFSPGQPIEQAIIAARNLLFVSTQLLVMVGSVYLAGRFVDRRQFRDFGFRFDSAWWIDLGFGLALGAVLMTGIFIVELVAGWVTVRELFYIARPDFAFWPWFVWGFLTFVSVGIYEELLFRGYLITNLSEGFTWFRRVETASAIGLATFVTAVFFGVAHAGNPNSTIASALGIVLAAFMLAAGYVLTGELAIPIGIHITWNFFQGVVYGFPVSGTTNGVSLIAIDQSGPAVITGGLFGPEAGVIGVVATLMGIGSIVAWVKWRGHDIRFDRSIIVPELRQSRSESAEEP